MKTLALQVGGIHCLYCKLARNKEAIKDEMFPVQGYTGGRAEFLVGCLQAKVTVVHLRCGLYYFKNVQKLRIVCRRISTEEDL